MRRRSVPTALALFVVIVGLGCTSGGADAEPATTSPPPAGWVATRTFDERDAGKTVELAVGTRFEIRVSQGRLPPRTEGLVWGEPVVKGDAIALVGTETLSPGPDVDGGVLTIVSRYEAERAGEATISMHHGEGTAEVAMPPYVLRMRVQ
jgi:hypothetical protein